MGPIRRKMADWFIRNLGLKDPALYHHFGDLGSKAGQSVTPDTTLGLPAALRCVRVVSETFATMPCKMYRRRRDGTSDFDADHPLYPLLHDSPNGEQTAFEFWEGIGQGLCMWGNAYAVKEIEFDRIVGLTPVRPDQMKVYRDEQGRIRHRCVVRGEERDLPKDRVFHVKGWGGNWSLTSPSPVALARHGLGLALAVEESASRFYANGMRPSGAVSSERVLNDDQRAKLTAYLDGFAGSGNTGRYLLLEAGFQYSQLALPPEDAQLLQSRAYNVEELCRIWGVPPFLVFHTEKSTSWGTGLEQQQIGFLVFTMAAYVERVEQAINRWLLGPVERMAYYAEFSVEGLLRADSKARAEFFQKMVGSGVYTPDEVRVLEGRRPMGGKAGELWMPSNMQPADEPRGAQARAPAIPETTDAD